MIILLFARRSLKRPVGKRFEVPFSCDHPALCKTIIETLPPDFPRLQPYHVIILLSARRSLKLLERGFLEVMVEVIILLFARRSLKPLRRSENVVLAVVIILLFARRSLKRLSEFPVRAISVVIILLFARQSLKRHIGHHATPWWITVIILLFARRSLKPQG